ncbi:hypothetical protein DERF_012083 [Dermatophagoides farinae]|uniref:Uncharacterized protein n=1 Tax=Dermatophagoides farinae TaxID=6954 RepID=A0A922HNX4_DERFA|nr:hypothetical protein DERF_012083 [Dermatophagoides farinae]
MFNTGLFNSEDTKLDYILKVSTLVNVFCLFVNSFFGYWISVDGTESDKHHNDDNSSWTTFIATAIIFYIFIGILSFSTFIAMCRHYSQFLIINGIVAFGLFAIGLFHPGLRENFFCFILLFLATFQYVLLGLYYQTIDQCQLRQHGYDCRGRCVQQEYVNRLKSLDNSLFSGRVQSFMPNAFENFNNNPGNQNDSQDGNIPAPSSSMSEVHFHNSIEQPEPPKEQSPSPMKPPRTINMIPENNFNHDLLLIDNNNQSQQQQQQQMTMATTNVEIESNVVENNLMSSQTSSSSSLTTATTTTNRFGHRRQPSQGSNQSMNNQLQHLDPSSFLQFT